ncbi:DUF5693 family protein [Anaerobacillus sp. MEB173]|uniref:DUF5693 family protein n=1 Tax=Anaerobacillus sp. MEB173 TaxID=3383345 RepID=UPI003F9299D6
MSQTFVKGALFITVATLVSKILGSIFRIPLQNIAGDEVLGIFTLVYPVYMAILIISVAGIPIAISKLISEARVAKKEGDIRDIFVTAGILAFAFGCLSFVLLFSFSGQIAHVLGGTYAMYSIIVVSFTLLIAPYMAVYRGFFQGFDNMKPTAFSQVLEQFVRVGLILIIAFYLVYLQYSSEIVAAGVMVGSSIGALSSLVYLRWLFIRSAVRPRSEQKYQFATFKQWSKKILILSIPICVGALTMALLNIVDSLTIPLQFRAIGYVGEEITYLYGIYGRGLALVQIAVVFASALILPLIPLITAALAKNEITKTKGIIERALKFTHLTSWPAALGLVALTLPINLALFKDLEGNTVLAIISFSALFTSMSVLTTGILQGMNRSNQAAIIVLISAIVKVVLNIVLVRLYGLEGAAISTLVTYMVLTGLNLMMINKAIPFKVVTREAAVFSFASIVMGIVIVAPLLFTSVYEWTRWMALVYVAVMIAVGGLIYTVLIFVCKGLTKEELIDFPVIGKFLAKPMPKGGETAPAQVKQKGRNPKMRKGLLAVLILSILLSSPYLYNRVTTEMGNNTYELIVPYSSIQEMTNINVDKDLVYGTLKEAGLHSIGLEPLTMLDLRNQNVVSMLSKQDVLELLAFSDDRLMIPEEYGRFLLIHDEDHPMLENIQDVFSDKLEIYEWENRTFYFIKEGYSNLLPLGFDFNIVSDITRHGLAIVPRIPNSIDDRNDFIFNELNELRAYGDKILFLGTEVVGFPAVNEIRRMSDYFDHHDYTVTSIEFADQKGMASLSTFQNHEIVRLHSIELGKANPADQVNVERITRGLKERNIRAVYLNILSSYEVYESAEQAIATLEGTAELIQAVHAQNPVSMQPGSAGPFDVLKQPFLLKALVLLGATAFVGLMTSIILPRLTKLAIGGTALVALLQLATGNTALLKLIALFVAVVTPVFAVLSVREINNVKQMILQYVKAIAIGLIGVWVVVGLLYGTEFLVKINAFTGVKALAVLPIVIGVFLLFISHIRTVLMYAVRYWHIAILGIVGVILLYYVTRTGNAGVTLPYENAFRQMLENVFYVRPRTTEFLIGFPLFFLGLYLTMKKKKYAPIFMVFGFIALSSMVSTFTHLHTPLFISVLRTVYSTIIGAGIGVIYILVHNLIEGKIVPLIKARW